MSGISNVRYWLRAPGYDPADEALCASVFEAAKKPATTPSPTLRCTPSAGRTPSPARSP
jgi:hypothetical protein